MFISEYFKYLNLGGKKNPDFYIENFGSAPLYSIFLYS